ncbi:TetR family transcriptional regulator [Nocardioides sp. KC13]|uniref:TetR family transcriptional regulator n=1 Tax=Nocardioides turkmenicus TaxID=2711220 RepID=A0A6M1R5P1_9ACTN|nr:TetR/AcrR family transcriptional regulator C-terminal domain-containing protein [Nocardioides sp. KC13]NGN95456.1 TetR family transcriptional regulator [Nocardioides sp. KC13]
MSDGVTDALWPAPAPARKRGPRPKLSVEDVVAAGIAVADADGVAAVTMQRVADELGAAKMALYRHVRGKPELIALMLDSALGKAPETDGDNWRERIGVWARTLHERMTRHPWTTELVVTRTVPGPQEMSWFEAGLAALATTPLTGAERLDTLALLSNQVNSSVRQAAVSADPEASLAAALAPIMETHGSRFPHTVAAFSETGESGAQDNALGYGIERILDGVASLISWRRSPSDPK